MADKGWGAPTWPTRIRRRRAFRRRRRACCSRRWPASARRTRWPAWAPRCSARRCWNTAPRSRSSATSRRSSAASCAGARATPSRAPGRTSPVLQTKCEDAGDHWQINGQKIWTSGAQYADWCFCLVRTDTSKKHEGISFVLINMHQPGVETRPIKLIAGTSPFCETFFTDARAEKDDMVGPLNGGWTIGKRLLQHERSGQGGGRMMAGAGRRSRPGQEIRRPRRQGPHRRRRPAHAGSPST